MKVCDNFHIFKDNLCPICKKESITYELIQKPKILRDDEIGKTLRIMFPEKYIRAKQNKCTECNNEITKFNDKISFIEYQLSGMCQDCQNDFFTGAKYE